MTNRSQDTVPVLCCSTALANRWTGHRAGAPGSPRAHLPGIGQARADPTHRTQSRRHPGRSPPWSSSDSAPIACMHHFRHRSVGPGRRTAHRLRPHPVSRSIVHASPDFSWIRRACGGGAVVAAGSVRRLRSGSWNYRPDAPRPPLPQWLASRLSPPPPAPRTPIRLWIGDRVSAYVTAALRDEAANVINALPGTG